MRDGNSTPPGMSWDDPAHGEPGFDEPELDEGRGTFLEVLLTIGAALLLAFLVQHFLVKPFKIPSGSMENTLRCGDRVLVDRLSYRFSDPERGDVVVFHPPAGIGEGGRPDPTVVADDGGESLRDGGDPRTGEGSEVEIVGADDTYIKRLIGMPGDKVEVRDHKAYVDGKQLDEPYLRPIADDTFDSGTKNWPAQGGSMTVPRGTYLMLGDHRDASSDGRVFGFVARELLIGKAFMVYWPPARFGGLPDRDPGGEEATRADPNCLDAGFSPIPDEGSEDG